MGDLEAEFLRLCKEFRRELPTLIRRGACGVPGDVWRELALRIDMYLTNPTDENLYRLIQQLDTIYCAPDV